VVEADGWYLLYSAAVPWHECTPDRGDISAGDMIISSFTVITPACMGAMLAAGVLQVEVVKRPVIGILPTGMKWCCPLRNLAKVILSNSTPPFFQGC
jgi:putative molybdopterin biosynthesis protein